MGTLPEGMEEHRRDYLHIMVDEEAKLLYSKWMRNPSSEEYKEAVAILVKCLREKNILYWIMDSTELKDVPMDDQIWAIREVASVAVKSSLNKVARITSDEVNMQAFLETAKQVQEELGLVVSVKQFHSYGEAVDWIEDK